MLKTLSLYPTVYGEANKPENKQTNNTPGVSSPSNLALLNHTEI